MQSQPPGLHAAVLTTCSRDRGVSCLRWHANSRMPACCRAHAPIGPMSPTRWASAEAVTQHVKGSAWSKQMIHSNAVYAKPCTTSKAFEPRFDQRSAPVPESHPVYAGT